MIKEILKCTMSFSPQELLSASSRDHCVANLKKLPSILPSFHDWKPNIKASVLVPLCVVIEEVCILYTLRASYLKSHSGQVSFPGGKQDGNESIVETALRETEEEIGIPSEDVDVWGVMSPIQGRNKDIVITPVVGLIRNFDMDKLVPNIHEVDEVFTVPISSLCNTNNHGHSEFKPPLPLFIHEKHKIWGITGVITDMFLTCFLPDELYKPEFMKKKFSMDELMPSKL